MLYKSWRGVRAVHIWQRFSLRTLAVNLLFARLLVLLFRDPHLLEAAEGGQDRAADPGPVPEKERAVKTIYLRLIGRNKNWM